MVCSICWVVCSISYFNKPEEQITADHGSAKKGNDAGAESGEWTGTSSEACASTTRWTFVTFNDRGVGNSDRARLASVIDLLDPSGFMSLYGAIGSLGGDAGRRTVRGLRVQ